MSHWPIPTSFSYSSISFVYTVLTGNHWNVCNQFKACLEFSLWWVNINFGWILHNLVKASQVSGGFSQGSKITVRSIFPGQVQVKDANKQKMKKKEKRSKKEKKNKRKQSKYEQSSEEEGKTRRKWKREDDKKRMKNDSQSYKPDKYKTDFQRRKNYSSSSNDSSDGKDIIIVVPKVVTIIIIIIHLIKILQGHPERKEEVQTMKNQNKEDRDVRLNKILCPFHFLIEMGFHFHILLWFTLDCRWFHHFALQTVGQVSLLWKDSPGFNPPKKAGYNTQGLVLSVASSPSQRVTNTCRPAASTLCLAPWSVSMWKAMQSPG